MSKEYGIETKLEQEQWGGGSTWEILLGGRMSEFSAGGGGLWGLPHPPSGENPVLKRPGNPVIRKI